MKIKLFVILLLALMLFVVPASATINVYNTTNISELCTFLGDAGKLEHVSGTTYLLKQQIAVADGARLFINGTDCTEFRIAKESGQTGGFGEGNFSISNTTIVGWNTTTSSAETITGNMAELRMGKYAGVSVDGRVVLHDVDISGCDDVKVYRSSNERYDNITIHDNHGGFHVIGNYNHITNLLVQNTSSGRGLEASGSYYTIDNVDLLDVGGSGIVFEASYSTLNDIYYDTGGYSGVGESGGAHDNVWTDVTILNNTHNAFDLHGNWDSTFNNVYVNHGTGNGIYTTGVTPLTYNLVFNDVQVYNMAGVGIEYSDGSYNISVYNATVSDCDVGVKMYDTYNNTLQNATITNTTTYGYYIVAGSTYLQQNCTFIDVSSDDNLQVEHIRDSDFINSRWVGSWFYPGEWARVSYYPNIKIVDSVGSPVGSATVTFTNEVSADSYNVSRSANGDVQTSFVTEADGYLSGPDDRDNMPALIDYYRLVQDETEFTWQINVSASGYMSNSTTGVNPDATWHSSDPNNPNATEIVIILPFWVPTSDYCVGSTTTVYGDGTTAFNYAQPTQESTVVDCVAVVIT